MNPFLYLLAAQAIQPAPLTLTSQADLRCVAAISAAASIRQGGDVTATADPELVERSAAFASLVGEKLRRQDHLSNEELRKIFGSAMQEVQEAAKGSGNEAAYYQTEFGRCRPIIEGALSSEADRLAVPTHELPRTYLSCSMYYALTYGVAYRRESEQGRYGAKLTEMFQRLYEESRSFERLNREEQQQVWMRDVRSVEANAAARQGDWRKCVLLGAARKK